MRGGQGAHGSKETINLVGLMFVARGPPFLKNLICTRPCLGRSGPDAQELVSSDS